MFYLFLLGLFTGCIFDPADRIFHIKMPFFCLCWFMAFIDMARNKHSRVIPDKLLLYTFLMLLLPLISVLYYNVFDGSEPYDGYLYFKSYLFITILLVLYVYKHNIIDTICILLTILSTVIIILYFIMSNYPILGTILYEFGLEYGNLAMSHRTYGNFSYNLIFYNTSPIIALSVSYYTYKAYLDHENNRKRYILLAVINIVAMFMAGTRNNMVMAFAIPLITIFWYAKRKLYILMYILPCAIIFSLSYMNEISAMLNPTDSSNAIKLGYFGDYYNFFSSMGIRQFIFGQGLGAYQYWNNLEIYASQVELTFFEIFRNYGVVGGLLIHALLFYPITNLFIKRRLNSHCITIGYVCYLLMSFSNPFLFSSSGMLVLSIVLASTLFSHDNSRNIPSRTSQREVYA